jgi:hypothetical protein
VAVGRRLRLGLLVSLAVATQAAGVGAAPADPEPASAAAVVASPASPGYAVRSDAKLSDAGSATDVEVTPDGQGLYVLYESGAIAALGTAPFLGVPPVVPGERATTLAALAGGYLVFTDRGRVYAYGTAQHRGDLAAVALNGPIIDSAVTPSGLGYWMLGSDGGVFSFGDAGFSGSTGDLSLNREAVGLVPDPDGTGYWFVAADGGVFAFDAPFLGSMGATPLNRDVVGMIPFGAGYLMAAADGGVFTFSPRPFLGSLGSDPFLTASAPVVGIAAPSDGSWYAVAQTDGTLSIFGPSPLRPQAQTGPCADRIVTHEQQFLSSLVRSDFRSLDRATGASTALFTLNEVQPFGVIGVTTDAQCRIALMVFRGGGSAASPIPFVELRVYGPTGQLLLNHDVGSRNFGSDVQLSPFDPDAVSYIRFGDGGPTPSTVVRTVSISTGAVRSEVPAALGPRFGTHRFQYATTGFSVVRVDPVNGEISTIRLGVPDSTIPPTVTGPLALSLDERWLSWVETAPSPAGPWPATPASQFVQDLQHLDRPPIQLPFSIPGSTWTERGTLLSVITTSGVGIQLWELDPVAGTFEQLWDRPEEPVRPVVGRYRGGGGFAF